MFTLHLTMNTPPRGSETSYAEGVTACETGRTDSQPLARVLVA